MNPLLRGYYNSRHDLMLKTAMILCLSEASKELTIDKLKEAIKLIEGFEEHLPKVFEGAGRNEQSVVATQILDRLRQHGRFA